MTETTIHYEVEFKIGNKWHRSSVTHETIDNARKYRAQQERYFGLKGRIFRTTTAVTKEKVK